MISAAALALTLTAAATPTAQGPWILTCNLTTPSEDQAAPNAARMFRIGPRLFQDWNAAEKQFGPNLCEAFSCRGDKDRLEGEISSSTLILRISLDLATGRATWRTTGASNLRTNSGSCSVKVDRASGKSPPAAT